MSSLLAGLWRLRRRLDLRRPVVGSVAVRHVDAGSCNGCEHELNALFGPHYDGQRHGVNIVASPRHADVLLVSGAVTMNMADALQRVHGSMPLPKKVVAFGDCALGRNVLGEPAVCGHGVPDCLPVDLGIVGCPPTPDDLARGLVAAMKLRRPDGGAGNPVDGVCGESGVLHAVEAFDP